jgi:hypothetical protein
VFLPGFHPAIPEKEQLAALGVAQEPGGGVPLAALVGISNEDEKLTGHRDW